MLPQLGRNAATKRAYSARVGQLNAQPTGCLTSMELTMSDQGQTALEGVDLAQAYLELTQALRDAKAENARLKAGNGHKLSYKVSDKGGVSVYGLGRFPVTLYAGQWPKLLAEAEAILAFIEANKAKLSFKD